MFGQLALWPNVLKMVERPSYTDSVTIRSSQIGVRTLTTFPMFVIYVLK